MTFSMLSRRMSERVRWLKPALAGLVLMESRTGERLKTWVGGVQVHVPPFPFPSRGILRNFLKGAFISLSVRLGVGSGWGGEE